MIRQLVTMSLFVLATAGTGCAQSSATPAPSETPSTATHQMHGPPGLEMLLVGALHHLDVTPAQKAAITEALRSIPPVIDRAMFAEAATAVRAGKLDPTALLAKVKRAASTPERDAALAKALDTLHATLTAEQRRGLVDAVGEHLEEHAAMPAHEHGLMQHLLGAGVALTDAQHEAIAKWVAAQPQPTAEAQAKMEAFHRELQGQLETFAGATFDATAFVAFAHGMAAMQMAHISHVVDGLARLLPLLDATQREAIAQLIEKAGAAQM